MCCTFSETHGHELLWVRQTVRKSTSLCRKYLGAAHKRLVHPTPRHVLFESDTDGAFPAGRRHSAAKLIKAQPTHKPILEEDEFEEAEASAGK